MTQSEVIMEMRPILRSSNTNFNIVEDVLIMYALLALHITGFQKV